MLQLSQNQILYGSNNTLPQQVPLRAGALTALFENGTLRHIKLGNTIILHQIYAALRDQDWGTITGELENLSIDVRDDSFDISFTSHHQQDHIDFEWTATITGNSSGTIRFHFDGQVNSSFDRNRLGFCVLHPTNCAGQVCIIEHVDGSITDSEFPEFISPHQPFFDIRAITHQVDGVDIRILMEGDTFEMEDQRNWTDASFKTYCTPLGLPFPVTVSQGDRIQQTITVNLEGNIQTSANNTKPPLEIHIHDKVLGTIPPIGLGLPESIPELSDLQAKRLSALHLSHFRVDIYLQDSSWEFELAKASEQATQLNCQLEIAVHLTDDAENQLLALKQFIDDQSLAVARWIIFHENEKSTTTQWVELARQYLGSAPIGAGTNHFFTELNRERPPTDAIDFAVYSVNPQVHAFDNLSLVETLAVQAENVKTARQFCGDKPIVVSPITLKMRSNPNATGDPPPVPDGELPPQVDERQMSLFGACWTLGSLKYNVESQVESITYYETIGWRGVMEGSQTPPLPEKFPSIADAVFPMYHVIADIRELRDAKVIHSQSSDNLQVDVLAVDKEERKTILIANMSPHEQVVKLNIPDGIYYIRRLNSENTLDAMTNPDAYRAMADDSITIADGSRSLSLLAYEYIRLQQEQA